MLTKENAAEILNYVTTATQEKWMKWHKKSWNDLDKLLITHGYEKQGFYPAGFYFCLEQEHIEKIAQLGTILPRYITKCPRKAAYDPMYAKVQIR